MRTTFKLSRRRSAQKQDSAPKNQTKLPVEILETIFVIASVQASFRNPAFLISFACVSRTVSTWVLPIFYETFYLSKTSLPRLIHSVKAQSSLFSLFASQFTPLYVQYPTTSIVIIGPPPEPAPQGFFSKRFPDVRRISFGYGHPAKSTNAKVFWQILAEVDGPEIVSFRIPQVSCLDYMPFRGFGMPKFQNTTRLLLNWTSFTHFPFSVKVDTLFPRLRLLFIEEVDMVIGWNEWSSRLLNHFAALPSLEKLAVTLAGTQFAGHQLLEMLRLDDKYSDKVVLARVKPPQFLGTFDGVYLYNEGYFKMLNKIWRDMGDSIQTC
ncbi:hypothetical protein DL96DRAFT_1704257 [Flagelloscypha sp. PMI_526]|nr:hypothetical protein DL96DRAFT_1704257 [Flagelloscypha sp. PMI_526]